MKIKNLILGIAGFGLVFSSCNLDSENEDNYTSGTYKCANLVVNSAGDAFASNATYSMMFYYLDGTLSATTGDLNLGGSSNVSFTTNAMPCETRLYDVNGTALDVTTFSGGTANAGGQQVTNLSGFLSSIVNWLSTNDPVNPAYKFVAQIPVVMSYNVGNAYTVKTFMPDAIYTGTTRIATVGSPAEPFTNDGVRYRVIFSSDYKKADVIFYNAKFAEAMPVTINFVLQNLDVEFNRNGYVISGKDLTPSLYESDGLTPAPNYQITSFEFINASDDLTVGTAMYTVQIGKAQYNGDFTGYYCLSGQKK